MEVLFSIFEEMCEVWIGIWVVGKEGIWLNWICWDELWRLWERFEGFWDEVWRFWETFEVWNEVWFVGRFI